MGIYVGLRSVPVVVPEAISASAGYRRSTDPAFPETLKTAKVTPELSARPTGYTVKKGDNLTRVVRDHLQARGESPSNSEVYAGVREVARANNLNDPDKIFPGQHLDLSILNTGATVPGVATPPTTAAVPREVIATPTHRSDARRIRSAPKMVPPANSHTASVHTRALPAPPLVPAQGGPELPKHASTVANLVPRKTVDLAEFVDRLIAPKETVAAVSSHESPWNRMLGGPARLSSEYGPRRDPFTGRRGFHDGIDLAAKRGTQIRAFRDGVVTFSGWQSGYGKVIIVQHADGLESVYAHQSKNLVREGSRVAAGAAIGEVGSTGRSTGPHLHFEIRKDGEAVNPVPYLGPSHKIVASR